MRSITINQTTMLNDFKEMWIPCTEREYPEVKSLLEGMGFALWGSQMFTLDIGVLTYGDGDYQVSSVACKERPTFTLSELRAMAKPNDDLRLLKERVGIMERSIMGMESKINEIHKLLFEE
jgi:hypothetical protein